MKFFKSTKHCWSFTGKRVAVISLTFAVNGVSHVEKKYIIKPLNASTLLVQSNQVSWSLNMPSCFEKCCCHHVFSLTVRWSLWPQTERPSTACVSTGSIRGRVWGLMLAPHFRIACKHKSADTSSSRWFPHAAAWASDGERRSYVTSHRLQWG